MSAADKSELRTALLDRRAVLNAERPLAGLTLLGHLPRIAGPLGVVSGYWPFRSEVDPRPLMARFARAHWRVALPVTPAKGAAAALSFRLWTPQMRLNDHTLGMKEPDAEAELVRPDVVLVPLLAFDAKGHRLGYGAGHYDRTLRELRASGSVTAIGLAYDEQSLDHLPTHAGDQPLDAILTERTYLEFAKTFR